MATNYGFAGPRIVDDGLVLYLDAGNPNSYNPSTPLTWRDISRNGNNGTLTNGPAFNSANGGSIVFDGVNDSCILPSTGTIIKGNTQSISICQWIKFTSTARQYSVALKRSDSNGTLLSLECNAFNGGTISVGTINLLYRNNTNTAFNNTYHSSNYNNGLWYFIVGTASSTEGNLYVNGVLRATTLAGILNSENSIYNAFVGTFANDQLWFNGNIANTLIYNKVLSQSEITQNYNATKGRFGL